MPRNGDVAKERVIVDPLLIDPKGGTDDRFLPSLLPTAKVVVSLSEHGSEDGTTYVMKWPRATAAGHRAGRKFPEPPAALRSGRLTAAAYHTRYPYEGERPATATSTRRSGSTRWAPHLAPTAT
jgi:prolyl oligopeptidase